MKFNSSLLKFAAHLIIAGVILTACSEQFTEVDSSALIFNAEKYESADEMRGARLYDTWWVEKGGIAPSGINPIWQQVAVDSGGFPFNKYGGDGGQWRCKECHGWDYKGSQGAYSITTDRYTGFRGINSNKTSYTKEYIYGTIARGDIEIEGASRPHYFYDEALKLNEQDLYDLTRFIFEIVVDDKIDISLGDSETGKLIYETTTASRQSCASFGCHKSSVGEIISIAQNDSAQFVHKVRFGSSGTVMPNGLINSDVQDVWAYVNAGVKNIEIPTSNFDNEIYSKLTRLDVAKGAQLYDNWWQASTSSTVPSNDNKHSLWPASNSYQQNSETWRCASCHGWDYRGKDGHYSNGLFATGIAGIINTENSATSTQTADNVYSYIKESAPHGFNNNLLSDEEYYALTKFIMTMRNESLANNAVSNSINPESRYTLNANTSNGSVLYQNSITLCDSCHGTEGDSIDFYDNDISTTPNLGLHKLSISQPWESIHAIRFGKPGTVMSGLYQNTDTLLNSLQAAIDILSHAQYNITTNSDRGARLYDKWWTVQGVKVTSAPNARNRAWSTSAGTTNTNTVSDDETWRCSTCHGWDYDGAQGALNNIQLDYYSGISGLYSLNTNLKDKNAIVTAISNGIPGVQDHIFSKYLSVEDIDNIVEFLLDSNSGMPASRSDYQSDILLGDSVAGELLYKDTVDSACINCHGSDGTAISSAESGYLSTNNRESFIHKVRFGHPGSTMVSLSNSYLGYSLVEAAHVYQYSNNLAALRAIPNDENASLVRGARLYENWLVEKQQNSTVTLPASVNPMWSDSRGVIPKNSVETWYCSTCHSWNYSGTVTGSGDNIILALASLRENLTETELKNSLFDSIKFGKNTTHDFGSNNSTLPTQLTDRDIWDLVKFILDDGVVNLENDIRNGALAKQTDINNGKGLYLGSVTKKINCAACHGYYGDKIQLSESETLGPGQDIFRTASAFRFPYRSLHYIRFGKAGTAMTGLETEQNMTLDNALNILDYLQQRNSNR